MDRKEAIELLKIVQKSNDTEMAHYNGDIIICSLLIELGYKDVTDEWDKISKWYA